MLYAFTLNDGRRVFYFGDTEKDALNVARAVHGAAVAQNEGQPVRDECDAANPVDAASDGT
jgi:hypothetical protein